MVNCIGTVYTMGDLIQIAADIAQQGIHFSDMRVVYFIYESIANGCIRYFSGRFGRAESESGVPGIDDKQCLVCITEPMWTGCTGISGCRGFSAYYGF